LTTSKLHHWQKLANKAGNAYSDGDSKNSESNNQLASTVHWQRCSGSKLQQQNKNCYERNDQV